MLEEFKKFALRGNVIDLAVGIIIGAAFNNIVQSVVNDIIMPPIGLMLGGLDFSKLMLVLKPGTTPPPYATPEAAADVAAVTLNYGRFINQVISFLIVAFAVFLLVRAMNRMIAKKNEPTEEKPVAKECPYCIKEIPLEAKRCPYCTSQLSGVDIGGVQVGTD